MSTLLPEEVQAVEDSDAELAAAIGGDAEAQAAYQTSVARAIGQYYDDKAGASHDLDEARAGEEAEWAETVSTAYGEYRLGHITYAEAGTDAAAATAMYQASYSEALLGELAGYGGAEVDEATLIGEAEVTFATAEGEDEVTLTTGAVQGFLFVGRGGGQHVRRAGLGQVEHLRLVGLGRADLVLAHVGRRGGLVAVGLGGQRFRFLGRLRRLGVDERHVVGRFLIGQLDVGRHEVFFILRGGLGHGRRVGDECRLEIGQPLDVTLGATPRRSPRSTPARRDSSWQR